MAADTIFALSTGRPPAAIAVIRLSGPGAHAAACELAGALPAVRETSVRSLRHPSTGERLDEALVLRFDAPASATGEDVVELHCHGGRAVVDAVLDALGSIPGMRVAEPGEFTRRAFANGRMDLTEVEGLADLLTAETESQRKAAMLAAGGMLGRQVEQWQARLLSISAALERSIDYAEEDTDDAGDASTAELAPLIEELDEWLARPRVEPLRDGVRIVVAGPPNAGKSSLINALVGEDRIIVSEVPGTTRDVVDVFVALGGLPLAFVDTAGLRDTRDPLEQAGIGRAASEIERADVLLWMGQPDEAPVHPRRIIVEGKSDLAVGPARAGSISVSSLTRAGLPELVSAVLDTARSLLPDEGSIGLNRRQASLLSEARASLASAIGSPDSAITADACRAALGAFDRLTGRAGVEDVLDAMFARFCLGK